MEETKITEIINAMQGLKYSDWQKLKCCVDGCFEKAAGNYKRELSIASPQEALDSYKDLF